MHPPYAHVARILEIYIQSLQKNIRLLVGRWKSYWRVSSCSLAEKNAQAILSLEHAMGLFSEFCFHTSSVLRYQLVRKFTLSTVHAVVFQCVLNPCQFQNSVRMSHPNAVHTFARAFNLTRRSTCTECVSLLAVNNTVHAL